MTAAQNSVRAWLAGTVVVCGVWVAPTAWAESLADTLVNAYRTSPDLVSQRSNVKILSEQAVQARAQGLVQVEGQASFTAAVRDFQENLYPTSLALNISQPLYTGGQVENATEAAEKRITAQQALLIATEQQVLLDAVTAFSDVVRDTAFVELGVNNVRVLTEQLRAANERFEVGEVTRTDVEQARARLAAAQSSLAAQRGSLEVSREAYRRAVGQEPGDLDPAPPLPPLPDGPDAAVALAMQNEPNLMAARINRDAAGSDVRAAIGATLPQVTLQAALSRTDTLRDDILATDQAAIGVTVTIPIYTSGFNESNIREAQARAEGAGSDITTAQRNAAQNVGVAWATLEVARASIEAGKLEVAAAQLAFEGVQEEAKVGARTTLDVLDAEQELLNARASLVSAQRDEYVASYSVLSAIGKLTVEHLGLQTDIDQSAATYYNSVRDKLFSYDKTDDTVWTLSWRP